MTPAGALVLTKCGTGMGFGVLPMGVGGGFRFKGVLWARNWNSLGGGRFLAVNVVEN